MTSLLAQCRCRPMRRQLPRNRFQSLDASWPVCHVRRTSMMLRLMLQPPFPTRPCTGYVYIYIYIYISALRCRLLTALLAQCRCRPMRRQLPRSRFQSLDASWPVCHVRRTSMMLRLMLQPPFPTRPCTGYIYIYIVPSHTCVISFYFLA